jgi:ankyrin repeat protein
LQARRLRELGTENVTESALNNLPTPDEVLTIYQNAAEVISKMDHNNQALARRALRLVLCARSRLLTTDELLSALRINPETKGFQLGAEISQERLRYLCPDILVLDWDTQLGSVWRLTHETCAAFFKSTEPEGQLDAARIYLKLLLESYRDPSPEPLGRADPIFGPAHPLQVYARHHWVLHVRAHQDSTETPDPLLIHLLKRFLGAPMSTSQQYQRWFKAVAGDDLHRPDTTSFSQSVLDFILPETRSLFAMGQFSLFGLLEDWWTDPALNLSARNHKGQTLLQVVDTNDPSIVAIGRKLVKLGVDVNQPQAGFCTSPLAHGVYIGDAEWVQFLVAHGASVDPDHGSALALAAKLDRPDLVRILLQGGAQVDADGYTIGYGSVLAAAAASAGIETVEVLIGMGADAGKRLDKSVISAVAAAGRNLGADVGDIVSLLVRHGANVNDTGGSHGSALGEACFRGNLLCLEALIEAGADVNQRLDPKSGGSALTIAVASGSLPCVNALIDAGADVDERLGLNNYGSNLAAAATEGHLGCLQSLLAAGADPNQVPLVGSYGSALAAAASAGQLDCLTALVEAGVDVNRPLSSADYGSALAAAAWFGDEACVAALLHAGADTNLPLPDCQKKLGTALAASVGKEGCMRLLIDAGADVNQLLPQGVVRSKGGSALAMAAELGRLDCLEMLISAGADANLLHKLPTLRCGSALVAAVFAGSTDCLTALIKAGARVEQEMLVGVYGNALIAAAGQGQLACMRALIAAGANVNTQVERHPGPCRTALAAAAYMGRWGAVALLVTHGAVVNQTLGGAFKNALHAAAARVSVEEAAVCERERPWLLGMGPRPKTLAESKTRVVDLLKEHGAQAEK